MSTIQMKSLSIPIVMIMDIFTKGIPTDRPTDRQTDLPTDRVTYRAAQRQLKTDAPTLMGDKGGFVQRIFYMRGDHDPSCPPSFYKTFSVLDISRLKIIRNKCFCHV